MTDYTVGDTLHIAFTTRAFATGIPTTLAGSPAVSAYEDASLTQITAGITLGVDHDSVSGLNMLTIVASGANGYESGKDYNLVVTAGTVSSVSVVGEVVGRFTLGRSAAAADLANGTDGLGAIKAALGTPTDLGGGASLADNNADMAGATFSSATDSQEATRNRGDAAWTTGAGGTPPEVLYSGTITTATSQTSLILSSASPADDTYLDAMAIITNQADATQKCFKRIISSVGSTGTITLESDPGVFTITDGDGISIVAGGVVSALTDAAAAVAAIFTHIELFTGDPNETFAGADPASFAGQVNTLMGTPADTDIATDLANAQAAIDALPSAADVNAQCDTALADYDAPTKAELDAAVAPLAQETTLGSPAGASMSDDIAAAKSDTAAILAAVATDGVVVAAASKTGYRLSATGVDDVLDEAVDGAVTLRQSQQIQNSAAAGKSSGAGTSNFILRDMADTKDRIDATISSNNRTAVTRNLD